MSSPSSFQFSTCKTASLTGIADTFGASEALTNCATTPSGYACIRVDGPDAATFLQGQITNDIQALDIGDCQTAALCNPKGRVIAPMDIARVAEQTFALVLLNTLVEITQATLSRYILRSKLTLERWPGQPPLTLQRLATPVADRRCRLENDQLFICRPSWLAASEPEWNMTSALPVTEEHSTDRDWRVVHVLMGWAPPQPATELEHIPQMLNLDEFDGVSMTKGCYTGQEIIARVHHRGSVKRRLRRYLAQADTRIQPGDSVENVNGASAGMVVETARDDSGAQGILAVIKSAEFSADQILVCNGQELSHWELPYSDPDAN